MRTAVNAQASAKGAFGGAPVVSKQGRMAARAQRNSRRNAVNTQAKVGRAVQSATLCARSALRCASVLQRAGPSSCPPHLPALTCPNHTAPTTRAAGRQPGRVPHGGHARPQAAPADDVHVRGHPHHCPQGQSVSSCHSHRRLAAVSHSSRHPPPGCPLPRCPATSLTRMRARCCAVGTKRAPCCAPHHPAAPRSLCARTYQRSSPLLSPFSVPLFCPLP